MVLSLLALLALAPLLQAVSLGPVFPSATVADAGAVLVCLIVFWGRGRLAELDGWAVGALMLTALWVAASGGWGVSPVYAISKGLAVAAWGGVALGLAGSGVSLARAVKWWITGAGLFALASGAAALLSPEAGLYVGGASIAGLPRFRGLFGHPNMMGDYLSIALILAVGYAWGGGFRDRRVLGLVVLLGAGVLMSVTTAWAGLGLALAVASLWGISRATNAARWARIGLMGVGCLVGLGTLYGTVRPLQVSVGPVEVVTSGLRPAIWTSAGWAVRISPVRGVGAAPWLAEAVDPLGTPGVPVLWDAHSTPLSILGQFGIVGAMLYLWLVLELTGLARRGRAAGVDESPRSWWMPQLQSAVELAVWLALLAALTHALVTASEDFRHLWLLLGLVGLQVRNRTGLVPRGDSA